jgi:two-component system alkaline phosphatase synthesis response regulator PhoP
MKETNGRKKKILIVDDDEDILDLLQYNFTREGYSVKCLPESSHALDAIKDFRPDLIILDLMVHPYSGIEVCRMIREQEFLRDKFIFFLTANAEKYSQHTVFNVGADEYIEKIAGLKPLMSKVSTVLKENYIIKKSIHEITLGCLHLKRDDETVFVKGKQIPLNRNEFEILFFLMQNEGKTISLRQLVNSLWGSKTFMDENTALNLVDSVRKKVGKEIIEEKRLNIFRIASAFRS